VAFLGRGVQLHNRRHLTIGRGVTLGDYVTIDALSAEGLIIGANVNIGPHTIIETTGHLSRIGKGCVIGSNSGIGAFSFIGAAGGVRIG